MQCTSSLLWRFHLLLLRLLGEISLSLLCSHSSWASVLDLAPPLHVGHLRVSVLCSDRTGLKEHLIRGLWLTQAGERQGYGVQGEPAVAEAGVTLQQPDVCSVFSWGSCPWIMGPCSSQLHRLPGGVVWIVICACTQDSWWLQQQPQHIMPISSVHADTCGSRPSLELVQAVF